MIAFFSSLKQQQSNDFNGIFNELGVPGNPKFPPDDIGISSLFIKICGEYMRYVAEQKSWYLFLSNSWTKDIESLQTIELCKLFTGAYKKHICSICEDEETRRFALRLTSHSRRTALLADARSIKPITFDAFDKNKTLLNCRNGTYDFGSMTFRNSNPADYITKKANVKYDPNAHCPRWEKFIDEIMCGDADTARYLQKVLGYACTGDASLEKLFLLYGKSTRNGKGTLMETVRCLLGDYAKSASVATIARRASDGSKPSPDLARLKGVRLVNVGGEPDRELVLNSSMAKQLTGGDKIVARYLNENLFEFYPEGKFFISSNYLPEIRDMTVFDSDRIAVIPFDRHFSEAERDNGLKDYFRRQDNLSGILNWLIEGYRLFRAESLTPSERIKESIALYSEDSDTMSRFLEKTVVPAEGEKLSTAVLYRIYTAWMKSNNDKPIRIQSFVGELRKRYIVSHDRRIGNIIKDTALVK